MINLVIDIGNTRAKLAVFEEQELMKIISLEKVETDLLRGILDSYGPRNAIISSVKNKSSDIIDILRSGTENFIEFNKETKIPITTDYQTLHTLGTDRLALATGAFFKYPGKPCLIIGAGTCITYDYIDEKGIYKGGAISPGLEMRFKAIHHFTDKLPLLALDDNFNTITGRTTTESILSGVQIGAVKEINGVLEEYVMLNKNLKSILCGGNTNYLYKKVKNLTFAEQNFLLYSLNKILIFNAS